MSDSSLTPGARDLLQKIQAAGGQPVLLGRQAVKSSDEVRQLRLAGLIIVDEKNGTAAYNASRDKN